MRIVVAIGGNALIRAGEAGTWEEQLENAREIAEAMLALRAAGHEVVLTHGNGPQVGALLLQHALGEAEAPPLPLDALIAMTQGQIGYLLETAIARVDPRVPTAVLLTRVLVDPDDPAFATPTKPVGPFYDEDEARRLRGRARLGRGARRRAAAGAAWSPARTRARCSAADHVRALLERGSVVIAGGGGGIPVAPAATRLEGVAGRDRQGPLLGRARAGDRRRRARAAHRRAARGDRLRHALGARARRGSPSSDAVRGLADGEFPAGSMGPKIESAERFVEAGGGRARDHRRRPPRWPPCRRRRTARGSCPTTSRGGAA